MHWRALTKDGPGADQTAREPDDEPILSNLDGEALAASKADMNPQQDQVLGYMAQDRIPVVYHGELAGYTTTDRMYQPPPATAADLGEVRDDAGNVVARWGTTIGVLPIHVVESPDFDLDAARAGGYGREPLTRTAE